jgi:hypothetical protein
MWSSGKTLNNSTIWKSFFLSFFCSFSNKAVKKGISVMKKTLLIYWQLKKVLKASLQSSISKMMTIFCFLHFLSLVSHSHRNEQEWWSVDGFVTFFFDLAGCYSIVDKKLYKSLQNKILKNYPLYCKINVNSSITDFSSVAWIMDHTVWSQQSTNCCIIQDNFQTQKNFNNYVQYVFTA